MYRSESYSVLREQIDDECDRLECAESIEIPYQLRESLYQEIREDPAATATALSLSFVGDADNEMHSKRFHAEEEGDLGINPTNSLLSISESSCFAAAEEIRSAWTALVLHELIELLDSREIREPEMISLRRRLEDQAEEIREEER